MCYFLVHDYLAYVKPTDPLPLPPRGKSHQKSSHYEHFSAHICFIDILILLIYSFFWSSFSSYSFHSFSFFVLLFIFLGYLCCYSIFHVCPQFFGPSITMFAQGASCIQGNSRKRDQLPLAPPS